VISLRLPTGIEACLFDLDGVLTPTAAVHAQAWKEMFDAYLERRAARLHEPFVPFDDQHDYNLYVDGRPRNDGVRTFLAARGITIPEGTPGDPRDAETVNGLATAKNELVLALLRQGAVEAYPGSVQLLKVVREHRLATAVVSASKNCSEVVHGAHIADFLDVQVDGNVAEQMGLRGKPAPDTYLAAARMLGVEPVRAAVFEDALAGVDAGRAGGFAHVVGVDRVGQSAALRAHGADVVVTDLAELLDGTSSGV
jgi:beta-phosphoglucomutase family hydrolase